MRSVSLKIEETPTPPSIINDDSTGEGQIETLTEGNSIVKEIGIYSKAVEVFNEEIAFNEEQDRLEYENTDWEMIIRKRRNRLLTRSENNNKFSFLLSNECFNKKLSSKYLCSLFDNI